MCASCISTVVVADAAAAAEEAVYFEPDPEQPAVYASAQNTRGGKRPLQKQKQGSVYLGFDQDDNEESML